MQFSVLLEKVVEGLAHQRLDRRAALDGKLPELPANLFGKITATWDVSPLPPVRRRAETSFSCSSAGGGAAMGRTQLSLRIGRRLIGATKSNSPMTSALKPTPRS